jgi:outer membrane protein OmpA-like peptidoglycan-associated protein
MAEALVHYDVEVVVEGAADEGLSLDDAAPLALARAVAAAEVLTRAGLKPERVSCSTHGMRRTTSGSVERVLNRRLELRVLPRGKA